MIYRKEIDGLRAIAITPVVLYHAGISQFSGGFIGVDVFFVISGYLIAANLLNELNTGPILIFDYYERRARRVLPALYFLLIIILPLAWFLAPPDHLKSLAKSLLATIGFASNVFFWHQTGYFDTANELKPLIHTWSVAIEEQYYVLFPWLFIFVHQQKQNLLPVIIFLLFFLSACFSIWCTYYSSEFAYFMLPSRMWELVLGWLVAIQHKNKICQRNIFHSCYSLLGLLIILYSVFAFDKSTTFPGVYAFLPALGSVLVIFFASKNNLTGKFLGNKYFVKIGLMSYSIYLWHQPILAFSRLKFINGLHEQFILPVILTSFIIAYLSWHFIERPFRNIYKIKRKEFFFMQLQSHYFLF